MGDEQCEQCEQCGLSIDECNLMATASNPELAKQRIMALDALADELRAERDQLRAELAHLGAKFLECGRLLGGSLLEACNAADSWDPHTFKEAMDRYVGEVTDNNAVLRARVAELEATFARVHEVARGYGFEASADVTHEAAVLLLLHGHEMLAYHEKRIAELEAKLQPALTARDAGE